MGGPVPVRTRSRAVARAMVRLPALAVCLAAGAVVLAAVVVPRLTGATPYAVLTGSMEPGLPPGTLVVVRPVDADEVSVGSVLTYQLRSGESTVVTHRVIGSRLGEDGREFVMQGDANPVPDREAVRAVQVRGEVWYSLPLVGRLAVLGDGHQRRTAATAIGVLLLLHAAGCVVLAVRGRRRTVAARRLPQAGAP